MATVTEYTGRTVSYWEISCQAINRKTLKSVTLYASRNGDPRGYPDMPVWSEHTREQFPIHMSFEEIKTHIKSLSRHYDYSIIPDSVKIEIVEVKTIVQTSRKDVTNS